MTMRELMEGPQQQCASSLKAAVGSLGVAKWTRVA